jgi:type IV pilus assembly protein PilA
MLDRSVALMAVAGISALLYFDRPLGERTAYKPRMYSLETAALKAIQTLNTAQVQYNSQFGHFAQSLTELGPPASGTDNASAANLISGDLATGEKQGYKFTLTGTPTGYTVSAKLSAFGSTGSRTFFSDQSLVIRESHGQEPATINSKELGSAAEKPGDRTK